MRDRVNNTTEQTTGGKGRLRRIWGKCRKPAYLALSVALWLAIWQYAAGKMDKSVLLPYPAEVWKAFRELIASKTFGTILLGSVKHIATGFGMALACGLVLAVICRFSAFAEMLLLPPMKLVKTVPVVSFIILLLLWVDPARISIVISFLIVLPVVYANVSRGIRETPPQMIEMAGVFSIPFLRRLRYLFIPNSVPYATAAVSTGLSLCWKAGIAAEIIGLSKDSIGRQLYNAKLYLDTRNLFAWTVVVILVSVLMEWIVMILFRLLAAAVAEPTMYSRPKELFLYVIGLAGRTKEAPTPADENNEEDIAAEITAVETVAEEPSPAESTPKAAEITALEPAIAEEISENAVEAPEPPSSKELLPVVEVTDIRKFYNSRTIIDSQTFSLYKGDVLLVTGASGSGKTTLLRCLLGLTEPDEGTVAYPGGKPRMAAVFQEDRLCEGFSARRNVTLATGASREEAVALLTELGIDDCERKPVRKFSGGMKRRTAWARALCAKPDLLILDEPFTGLDSARKDQLIEKLRVIAPECAIVIVTHNTSEITNICSGFSSVKRIRRLH